MFLLRERERENYSNFGEETEDQRREKEKVNCEITLNCGKMQSKKIDKKTGIIRCVCVCYNNYSHLFKIHV